MPTPTPRAVEESEFYDGAFDLVRKWFRETGGKLEGAAYPLAKAVTQAMEDAHAAGVRAERERVGVLLRELRRHLMEYATTEPDQTADDYRTEDHDQIERIDAYLKESP